MASRCWAFGGATGLLCPLSALLLWPWEQRVRSKQEVSGGSREGVNRLLKALSDWVLPRLPSRPFCLLFSPFSTSSLPLIPVFVSSPSLHPAAARSSVKANFVLVSGRAAGRKLRSIVTQHCAAPLSPGRACAWTVNTRLVLLRRGCKWRELLTGSPSFSRVVCPAVSAPEECRSGSWLVPMR